MNISKKGILAIVLMLFMTVFLLPIYTSRKYDVERELLRLQVFQSDSNYAVILDCGSSGSRVYVYRWEYGDRLEIASIGERKASPGISVSENVEEHLRGLLEYAQTLIPYEIQTKVPILLYATAGMRLLPETLQLEKMSQACQTVSKYFSIQSCDVNVRIISGELEGIFGWLTINYLKTKFEKHVVQATPKPKTFGFIDIGGASAQIAFQPISKLAEEHADDLWDITLRYPDGVDRQIGVFVGTFLGFGANEARRRYVQEYAGSIDPCLPIGLNVGNTTGVGIFDNCMARITPLLNKHKKCTEDPCLFNGMHAPIMDFNNHRFIGVSEVWYTTFDVYDLGGKYNYKMLYDASKEYCESHWDEIVRKFEAHQVEHVDNLERLQQHCFKSAYLLNVLHNGFGFPKESTSLESMEELEGMSLSWTLGAIFIYASSVMPMSPRLEANLQNLTFLEFVLGCIILSMGFVLYRRRHKSRQLMMDVSQYHRSFSSESNSVRGYFR
jgi:Golgi nucleoside diphosphatase